MSQGLHVATCGQTYQRSPHVRRVSRRPATAMSQGLSVPPPRVLVTAFVSAVLRLSQNGPQTAMLAHHDDVTRIRPICNAGVMVESTAGAASSAGSTYDNKCNTAWLAVEADRLRSMQRHIPGGLLVTRGQWQWTIRSPSHFQLVGHMQVFNETKSNEIFITQATAEVTLLSSSSVEQISCSAKIDPIHPGGKPAARKDGYWVGYIIRARESTAMEVTIDVRWSAGESHSAAAGGEREEAGVGKGEGSSALLDLEALRLDVSYVAYGPMGRLPASQQVILPLQFPSPSPSPSHTHTSSSKGGSSRSTRDHDAISDSGAGSSDSSSEDSSSGSGSSMGENTGSSEKEQQQQQQQAPAWREVAAGVLVLPVRTHLLCHLDDPVAVIQRYALPHMLPGDVVALGETPLAIMQGRFRHPSNVHPGVVARAACKPFHPTSSLATACGMQALVDIVGALRVILAVLLAAVCRLVGQRGMFYRLAGEQARLIDDVTGTLPPYDQFITLGPLDSQAVVDDIKSKHGIDVAIVDVNDLRRLQVLAAPNGVDLKLLSTALVGNPAGNADEQTPVVIVRTIRRGE